MAHALAMPQYMHMQCYWEGQVSLYIQRQHVSNCSLLGEHTCFYGRCYYCKPAEAACANGSLMEGSLTLWLPDHMGLHTWRHPYQRTYRDGVKARYGVTDVLLVRSVDL